MENKTTYTEEVEQELREASKLTMEQETETSLGFTYDTAPIFTFLCC